MVGLCFISTYINIYIYICVVFIIQSFIYQIIKHTYIYRYILHKHICIYDLGLLKLHVDISIIYIYINKTYKVHYQIHNGIVTYHIAMMITYHKNRTIY